MFAFILQLTLALNFALASPAATLSHPKQWPHGPFTTKGTQILNFVGDPFVYVGMNWPGEGEVMIPEGLQYSSISDVVSKIKSLGMNSVRMGVGIGEPRISVSGCLCNHLRACMPYPLPEIQLLTSWLLSGLPRWLMIFSTMAVI